MKRNVTYLSLFLLIIMSAVSFIGCSNMTAPTDEEVVKAINENNYYKSGTGVFTLIAPIVILEKGGRNKDGSWPVKIKVIITHKVGEDKVSAPIERTPTFNMYKEKDSAGKVMWRAELVGNA